MKQKIIVGIASVLICLSTGVLCGQQSQTDSIWGPTILEQPFDKSEFRAIRLPKWVEETTGVGYTLSVQNAAQRARAVEAGVTISEMGFVDPFYVYYDSHFLKNRNPHVPRDHVDKEVAEYRRLGLRILAVYPPTLQSEAYQAHPDWRRVPTNVTEVPEVDLEKHPYGGMLCLLGPYGDFFIDVLAEITEKYQVDAFSFDGLHYGGVCYCEHCRANFRSDTGKEIPDVNMDDPAFRRYQHWADRRMENVMQRMQERLKKIKPDVALVTWTTNAGRFGHFRDIPRNMPARMNLLLDAPDQEFWLDETNRGATVVPALANAYIWACTNHRVAFSEPYLMSHGNPYGKDSFPAHEVLRRVMLSMTHGTSPSLAVIQSEQLQKAAYDALAEIQRRKPWLTHKQPEPWGAMLLSDNTRVFYGRESGKVEDRYLAHVFGTYRAVLEEHLPVTLICDWNLTVEELAKYKVLVLPNAACLSDTQAEAVREYVRQGGGLVASLDTSLCNEFGDPRDDFALADLFDAHHQGSIPTKVGNEEVDVNFARGLTEAYWQQRKNVFDFQLSPSESDAEDKSANESFTQRLFDDARLTRLIGRDRVTFKGPAVRVHQGTQSQVAAAMTARGVDAANPFPAMISRSFGKGRVVYLAAGLDHAYYSYAYPYQRLVLKDAICWSAANPPPVEIEAPMCVQGTVFRQQTGDADRLLIHLFNDVNTTAFHALPDNDVPLREETLPIHDIRIRLHGYQIKNATQQPEAIELLIQQDNETMQLMVPRLDMHSIIVIDLK